MLSGLSARARPSLPGSGSPRRTEEEVFRKVADFLGFVVVVGLTLLVVLVMVTELAAAVGVEVIRIRGEDGGTLILVAVLLAVGYAGILEVRDRLS